MKQDITYSVVDNSLHTIITTTETRVAESSVTLDYLYNQLTTIQARQDADNAAHDAEKVRIQEMIDQCKKFGLKTQAELDAEKVVPEPDPIIEE